MSRSLDLPNAGPTCPLSASLTLDILASDDWQLTVTWAPNVTFLQADFIVSVNGGPPTVFDSIASVTSPTVEDTDPNNFAGGGDTVQIHVSLTGADACPDIVSNTVTVIIP